MNDLISLGSDDIILLFENFYQSYPEYDITDDKSNSKCPECLSLVVFKEGCLTCPSCGWGYCT